LNQQRLWLKKVFNPKVRWSKKKSSLIEQEDFDKIPFY